MKRQPTINELCARHHNESLHTEHVARLGLAIFDRVRQHLGIPRRDRRLFEAACRLHDIGYSMNPADHARVGAGRLLRAGVAGFSKDECRFIAAVILLHQKRYKKQLRDPLIHSLLPGRRILELAALLRVADGLDHEHVQNVSVTSVRLVDGAFRVSIRGGLSNIPAARAKADLWREVFPNPIVFDSLSSDAPSTRPTGPADVHDTVLETARRLLCVHYRVIADNLAGAAAARSPTPLHDIRVAIRRLCAVLRAFRGPLEGTTAAALAGPLARLNASLGPIRDRDVWLAFLAEKKLRCHLESHAAWPAYVAFHESARQGSIAKLRLLFHSRRVRRLMNRTARVCRLGLPDLIRTRPSTSIGPLAVGQLRPLFDEVVRHKDVAPATSPADLHKLRKVCRRGRYYAEMFAPTLGPVSDDLVRRFTQIADPLGRIHDTDEALRRIEKETVKPPRQLKKILVRRRAAAWKDFKKAWKDVRCRKFVKQVARELQ